MILPSIFGSSSSAKISKLEQEVSNLKNTKVDKITGKGLSTYDFTAAYCISLIPLFKEGQNFGRIYHTLRVYGADREE